MIRLAAILCTALALAGLAAPAHASSQTATAELLAELEATLPWDGATAMLNDVRIIGTWPDAPRRYDLPEPSSLREHLRVRVTGADGDMAWVTAQLVLDVPVYVAASALQRGDRAQGRAMIELRSLASLPRDAVLADTPLDDRVARVTIRQGDVLRELSLEVPVVVERNQIVEVTVQRGAIVVQSRGVALEPGRAGDVVRVRNANSENVYTAIVRGPGRVEVP